MRLMIPALMLAMLSGEPAMAQQPPREVNITQGSEAEWLPSEELEAQAIATWQRFHALVEAGDFAAAHGMMGEGFRLVYPLTQFRKDRTEARTAHGALIALDLIKLTWTKDSPGVPYPGIYAAIDASAVFEAVDRSCGYTILHRAPDANDFTVLRMEDTILDNASYADIASNHSELQALLVWRLVSRNCPNYRPEPLPDTLAAGIGYDSVAEARATVAARPGIETKMENGWTIIADKASLSVWSFAPEGVPTYPAVIKRWVEPTGENTSRMSMAMRCGGEKRACDALFDEMALMNGLTPVSMEQ